ncbi:MAG TPA: cyclopropane-fatty-acyl-phospholipid synthase family protein [Chthoniobacteraceae bacterium]|nr:cyclopropane-fatty-acyl-phospholipid synthase family protein [Chthoniobacteraceae bacterium]
MKVLTAVLENVKRRDAGELTRSVLDALVGERPLKQVRVKLWDGSCWPDAEPRRATLRLNHPGALRAMLSAGTEVALAEAYLRDDFDVEGDLEAAFELADVISAQTGGWTRKLKVSAWLRQLPEPPGDSGDPDAATPHRAALNGRRHTPSRDREAIHFHYDLSNAFYALWLDSRRVYSCACFKNRCDDLESAQRRKLEMICRKLDLRPGQRLLDVGCGWGGLVIHAARDYGVTATGITLSARQADHARQQVRELGLEDRVEIRLEDYREHSPPQPYDAIASVGMVEHVGRRNLPLYFQQAFALLQPGGLFLNHGIGTGIAAFANRGTRSFINEYVFPDGELVSIAEMLHPAETSGFSVRDVENLREHYALTLRHWVRRLEQHHDEALHWVEEPVYRIWRLYMAGCAHSFACHQLAIYQSLLEKPTASGRSPHPLTRDGWYC